MILILQKPMIINVSSIKIKILQDSKILPFKTNRICRFFLFLFKITFMTLTIIIIICVLLLLAYLFDLTSSKTRIPTVILLLVLGYLVRQGTVFFEVEIPDLTVFLQLFGTLGLILIVLEGGLELEFNKSKLKVINKSFLVSVLSIIALSFVLQLFCNFLVMLQ